jgi:type IV pilus assembly protein PilQ
MRLGSIIISGCFVLVVSGCAMFADRQVTKDTVPENPQQVRAIIKDARAKSPVDTQDRPITNGPSLEKGRSKDLFTLNRAADIVSFGHSTWRGSKVSLNLSAMPVQDYFKLLHEITGIKFIVGQEVQGEITLKLSDIAWTEATEIILSDKKLIGQVSKDGKSVRINTIGYVTDRTETTKKVLSQRLEEQKMKESLSSHTTAVIRVFYSKVDAVAKTLKEMLVSADAKLPGQAAAGRAILTVDSRTNSIIAQASPEDIDWIKKTVAHIDKPSRQVLVEVFIVEGRDNFSQELGVRLGLQRTTTNANGRSVSAQGIAGSLGTTDAAGNVSNIGALSNPGVSTPVGGLGMLLSSAVSTNQVKVELLGMEKDGLTKIISNPRLFILDNEQASITDGVQIAYPVAGVGQNQITYEFKDAALKVDVKPSIVGDGNIYIEVTVNKDSPNLTTNPPAIDKREVKTKLLIRDGGVAMIGGINTSTVSSTDNQVPVLGNVPILGNLFKSTAQGRDRRQLYIFLAPSTI